MKFQFGKIYKHTTGSILRIVGFAYTYTYGQCFVGEDECGNLSPVGMTEDHSVNFTEITESEVKK